MRRLQQNQMEEEMKECSFTPKIDSKSQQIAHKAIERYNCMN